MTYVSHQGMGSRTNCGVVQRSYRHPEYNCDQAAVAAQIEPNNMVSCSS